MPFYKMAIIDTCENVLIQDFSVAKNLKKHCGFYNGVFYCVFDSIHLVQTLGMAL